MKLPAQHSLVLLLLLLPQIAIDGGDVQTTVALATAALALTDVAAAAAVGCDRHAQVSLPLL
jgi:hypothetical protein